MDFQDFDDRDADAPTVPELDFTEPPLGSDRRAFMMRSALVTAMAALAGRPMTAFAQAPFASPAWTRWSTSASIPTSTSSAKSKGPVMTLIDEFYKVGPGPSSSHTIGPMRITYDFYQRATKLPAADLAKATKFRVNLFGSLSATGKGHGTERASLAGLTGMEPATTDPAFLDGLAADPTQVFQVKLGSKEIPVSLADVIYDETKGDFHHPNTMTGGAAGRRDAAARAGILFGRRRLHRVEGLHAAGEEPRRSIPTRRWPRRSPMRSATTSRWRS